MMTRILTTIAPANSIIFVSGRSNPRPPSPWRDVMVLSDSSCVMVRCYPEVDGPTEIVIGDALQVDPGFAPAFSGTIETENREIVISGVERERILEAPVPNEKTKIRVWLSHPQWPDRVTIGIVVIETRPQR